MALPLELLTDKECEQMAWEQKESVTLTLELLTDEECQGWHEAGIGEGQVCDHLCPEPRVL